MSRLLGTAQLPAPDTMGGGGFTWSARFEGFYRVCVAAYCLKAETAPGRGFCPEHLERLRVEEVAAVGT